MIRNTAKNIVFLMTCLVCSSSWALNSFDGKVSFEKLHRLNSPEYTNDFNEWAGFSLTGTGDVFHLKGHFDSDFRVYFNSNNSFNYSIPEAYLEYDNQFDSKLTIGRKLLDWNVNEQYWMLGNLNGQQGMQLLSEKQEGLIGLHLDKKIDRNFGIQFFFSYLYVPSMNPGLTVEDGKITSNSEWIRRPPEYTEYEGELIPINYNINYPDVTDVIFKKSIGLQSSYKWEDGEFSSFIIYKPENNIRANAEAPLRQDSEGNYFVDVTADPVVNHHMIYGVQIKQNFGDVKTVTGFDITDPNARLGKDLDSIDLVKLEEDSRSAKDSDYITIEPSYEKETYLHASAYLNRNSYDLMLGFIHNFTDSERGSDDFYSEAKKWRTAMGGKARYYFKDALSVAFDYKYDFKRKDQIIKAEGYYRFAPQADFRIGAELLRSPADNSYWSAYRAHDTIYTNIRYHF